MTGLDALRCAKLLLDQHGDKAELVALEPRRLLEFLRDGAELVAAMRADELEAVGDEARRRAWMRILAAIDELARTARRPDESLQ